MAEGESQEHNRYESDIESDGIRFSEGGEWLVVSLEGGSKTLRS